MSYKRHFIGKRKVDQTVFDLEVLRLFKGGKKITEIAERLRCERSTIWRSMKRLKAKINMDQVRVERKFIGQSHDEFLGEPSVQSWRESLLARTSGMALDINQSWLKRICDKLEIFPDQLDLELGRKYLVNCGLSDLTKRHPKLAIRSFLKHKDKVSDAELLDYGIDSKHIDTGKWKHIQLTEDHIQGIIRYLKDNHEALFAFLFGLQTCSRAEEIQMVGSEHFTAQEHSGRQIYTVNIPTPKTEASGSAYQTGWVSQSTYMLARSLGQGRSHVVNGSIDRIRSQLKDAYRYVGLESEYFYDHALHCLRHAGGQRYLQASGYNRSLAKVMGHWKAEKTLEDHYGAIPMSNIFDSVAGIQSKPKTIAEIFQSDELMLKLAGINL